MSRYKIVSQLLSKAKLERIRHKRCEKIMNRVMDSLFEDIEFIHRALLKAEPTMRMKDMMYYFMDLQSRRYNMFVKKLRQFRRRQIRPSNLEICIYLLNRKFLDEVGIEMKIVELAEKVNNGILGPLVAKVHNRYSDQVEETRKLA